MWDMTELHPARFPSLSKFFRHGELDPHATAASCIYWLRWGQARSIPSLRIVVYFCATFVSLVCLDRLLNICLEKLATYLGKSPSRQYKSTPLELKDESSAHFPTVLAQIPVHDEEKVFHLTIAAVTRISWPRDRLIVQVLDDSTDPTHKEAIKHECEKWVSRGINVKYEAASDGQGLKAGSLKAGLEQSYVRDCNYVAVIGANNQPPPNFLERFVPYLVHNPELGHVLCSWKCVNCNDSLFTRLQGMMIFKNRVAEAIGSTFFGFAMSFGTSGVWRVEILKDSRGWEGNHLVEEAHLSLSSAAKGWRSVYIADVPSLGKVAGSYSIFRRHQNRWTRGMIEVVKLRFFDVLKSKNLNAGSKYFILVSTLSYIFYEAFVQAMLSCILIPVVLLVPDINVPGAIVAAPFLLTVTDMLLSTPRSLAYVVPCFLLEIVKGVYTTRTGIYTILGINSTNCTDPAKQKSGQKARYGRRSLHYFELLVGLYLFLVASFATPWPSVYSPQQFFWQLRIFLYFQALAFFWCGIDGSL